MNIAPPLLSNFSPPLPETLVANLSVLNIRTAPDLIFVSPAELLKRLPAGSITFIELTHHIAHVRQGFAGPAITGDKLIEELGALAQLESVHSGLPALDGLVGGSFDGASGGRIIEISGPSTSGKTVCSSHFVNVNIHYLSTSVNLGTCATRHPASS
jgi:RAD51-like protein 3